MSGHATFLKASSTGSLLKSKGIHAGVNESQGKAAYMAQTGVGNEKNQPLAKRSINGLQANASPTGSKAAAHVEGTSASESAAETPRTGAQSDHARGTAVAYQMGDGADGHRLQVPGLQEAQQQEDQPQQPQSQRDMAAAGGDAAQVGRKAVPDRRNDKIKDEALHWARRAGFTQEQLVELGHMMSMVASSHINPRALSKMTAIDRGMFGQIFKSTFEGEQVAVKRLGDSSPASFKQKMRELLLELRVLTRISHPNIVHFYGTAADFVVLENGGPYVGLVFSLCDRGSLDKALFQDRNLTIPQKLSITRQMSEALTYMHCKRVVHRDLNTKNVLLTANCTAQIADFGCARHMTQETLRTTTISGSPAYMSPEQITGEPLTLAVDVWAFSIILWEVMMDQKPWEGVIVDFNQLRNAIVRGQKLVLPESHKSFPNSYIHAIKIGMQTKASERPKMAALRQELTNAMVFYKPQSTAEEAEMEVLRQRMVAEQDDLIKQYVSQQANRQVGQGGAGDVRQMQQGVQQLGAWSPSKQSENGSTAPYNQFASAEDEEETKKRKGIKGFLKNLCFLV